MSAPTDRHRTGPHPAITRRQALRLTAAGAVTGLATAARPRPARGQAPGVSRGTPVSIKLVSWFWNEPGRADAWRAMVAKFHEVQKDIRVEEAGWPFNEFTNRVIVQLQAGKIDGDLLTTTPDLVLRLLKANQLEPVGDVIDRLGIKNLSRAHDFIRRDGKLYGLDVVTVAFGLLYNAKLYDQAGIKTPPRTIDEWKDVTARLTKRPDQFGIFSAHLMAQPESFWFTLQEWAMPFDGRFAEGKKPTLTAPGVIKGLQLFKAMYDCCMPQGTDDAAAIKLFTEGRIAQRLIVSASVNVLRRRSPELYPHLRSATPPWPSRKSITRIHPICVNAQSDKKPAAKAFLEFLYKPEHYRELLERALDVIPAYPDGIRKEYLQTLHWVSGYNAIDPVTPPEMVGDFIFNNQEFGQIVITRFQECLTANRPVEAAMADAQKEADALALRIF
jgi:ABC-type glycerol-3-phosphate transport system substrate-binding protein